MIVGPSRSLIQGLSVVWAGGAFSPADIAGLALWLDADDIDTLFQNNTLATPVTADGQAVGGWTDKSANSRNGTQSTAGSRPLYKTGIIGGLPVVRFDDSDDVLSFTSFNLLTTHTIFVIFRHTAAVATNDIYLNNSSIEFAPRISATGIAYQPNGTSQAAVSQAFSGQTPYMVCVKRSGVSVDFYLDGTQTGATQTLLANNNFSVVRLGHPSTIQLGADVGEIIVYDSALSDLNRNLVETYLFDKWGFL